MICNEVQIDGDRVASLNLNHGLCERPMWKVLETLPWNQAVPWVARFAPMESLSAQWALAMAFENALQIQVPARAQFLRALFCEAQRAIWCSHYLERIFMAIEYPWRASRFARSKELGFQFLDQFLGARILPHWFLPGGVQCDLSRGELRKATEALALIERWFDKGTQDLAADWICDERFRGVLPLSYEFMQALMAGGPIGQASGLQWDLREVGDGYGIYRDYPVKYFAAHDEQLARDEPLFGDVLLRVQSVIFQAQQSFTLAKKLLADLPGGPVAEPVSHRTLPAGYWWGGVEAPSGAMYAAIAEGSIRLASTSTRLAGALERLLVGVHVEDLDLALNSLGYDPMQGDLRW